MRTHTYVRCRIHYLLPCAILLIVYQHIEFLSESIYRISSFWVIEKGHWCSVAPGFRFKKAACSSHPDVSPAWFNLQPREHVSGQTPRRCVCAAAPTENLHILGVRWRSFLTCILQGEASFLARRLLRGAVVNLSIIRSHYLLQHWQNQQSHGQFDQHCVPDGLRYDSQQRSGSVCVRVHLGSVIRAAAARCLMGQLWDWMHELEGMLPIFLRAPGVNLDEGVKQVLSVGASQPIRDADIHVQGFRGVSCESPPFAIKLALESNIHEWAVCDSSWMIRRCPINQVRKTQLYIIQYNPQTSSCPDRHYNNILTGQICI